MINGIAKTLIKTSLCASSLIPCNSVHTNASDNISNQIITQSLQTEEQMPTKKYIEMINDSEIIKNNGWGNNVKILASNGQEIYSYTRCCNSFSTSLINKLKNKNVRTIEQANDTLAQNGYITNTRRYYSLETPGDKLDIFNKNDNEIEVNFSNPSASEFFSPKERYILTCVQDGEDLSEDFKMTEDYFTTNLKELYGIPDKNIIRIKAKTGKDFLNGIDSVAKKLNTIKNKEKAELMIYYNGHCGSRAPENISLLNQEGSYSGYILTKFDKNRDIIETLWENTLKQKIKNKIKNIKTLLIFDTCFSGAWIAQSNKANKTLTILKYIA